MVYLARRQRIQVHVNQFVTAHYHRGALLAERIHNALQSVRTAVYVIGIQLDGKASAMCTADGIVPTTANAEIVAPRYQVNHAGVIGELLYLFARSIGRMVVYHNHVEIKIRLLRQDASDGFRNRPFAVSDRYDDRCFAHETFGVEINILKVFR